MTTATATTLSYPAVPARAGRHALLRQDRWTVSHVIFAAVMASLGIFATLDAWRDIFHIAYNDEEYSHIFIVPVVAAWMILVRRERFRYCRPTGTILGPIFILVGGAIRWYGFYDGVQSFWHGGSVLVVLGCVLSVLGKPVLFRFLPAVAVLIFLVPVPNMIRQDVALPLQAWTAHISQVLLQGFGIDSDRSGNLLIVNGKPVTIAEACNGLRMVFPLFLVSFAFCFGLPLRNSVRFFILLASPLAAIFCNVLRILPTILFFGYLSPETANKFHDMAGWAMLPISFLLLLGIIRTLRWAMIPVMKYTLASQ